jgi:hypothetical protein
MSGADDYRKRFVMVENIPSRHLGKRPFNPYAAGFVKTPECQAVG